MNTIKKKIMIKFEDSFGDKFFEIVEADMFVDNNSKIRYYKYDSKLGKCEILLENDIITINRNGKYQNQMMLKFNGEKEKTTYQTDFIREDFYCSGIKHEFNPMVRIFSFSYLLLSLSDDEINSITFSIKEI